MASEFRLIDGISLETALYARRGTALTTLWVMDWIVRMQEKYGCWVQDRETGKRWDWGQALCREMYGPDWNDDPAIDDAPAMRDVLRAKAWEEGDWPN